MCHTLLNHPVCLVSMQHSLEFLCNHAIESYRRRGRSTTSYRDSKQGPFSIDCRKVLSRWQIVQPHATVIHKNTKVVSRLHGDLIALYGIVPCNWTLCCLHVFREGTAKTHVHGARDLLLLLLFIVLLYTCLL